MYVESLSKSQIHEIVNLLKVAKFPKPDPNCLSPVGEYNLRLGIMKEMHPDMVATHTEPPNVYEGHPFIVQASVSLGGQNALPGITVYRFANRIPLLFEAGNDVVSQIASKKINWSSYKIKQSTDKIGVFVSIVSTKIPFKGTSKEYIGDDKGVMNSVITKALKECCVQLRKRIVKVQADQEKADRKRKILKYIPDVSKALMEVLQTMGNVNIGSMALGPLAKKPRLASTFPPHLLGSGSNSANDIVKRVQSNQLTIATLSAKLQEHVEKVDESFALEYVLKGGTQVADRVDAFSVPIEKMQNVFTQPKEIFHPNFAIKFAF
jgi:hypothetical protein